MIPSSGNKKILKSEEILDLNLQLIDAPQELNAGDFSNQLLIKRKEFNLYQSNDAKLNEILQNQNHITKLLKDTKEKVTVVSFANQYKINFPFETKDEFEKFDGRLKTESSLRLDFISLLNFCYALTITTISKQLINLFKRILVKNLAFKYTGSRKSGEKIIIKDFEIMECLNGVFKANNCGNPSDILQAVGVILSNAEDWEGSRKK